MKFHHVMSYEAAAGAVYAMLIDPQFQAERARAGNPERSSSAVEPAADGGAVITVNRLMAVDLPAMLQKLAGEKVEIVETQTWTGAPANATTRDGRLQAGLSGQGGGVNGTLRLDGTGSPTTVTVDADIKINVPLIGGKIENYIAEMLTKFLTNEQDVGRSWLSRTAPKP